MTNKDNNIFKVLKKNRKLAAVFISYTVFIVICTVFCSTYFAAGDPISGSKQPVKLYIQPDKSNRSDSAWARHHAGGTFSQEP